MWYVYEMILTTVMAVILTITTIATICRLELRNDCAHISDETIRSLTLGGGDNFNHKDFYQSVDTLVTKYDFTEPYAECYLSQVTELCINDFEYCTRLHQYKNYCIAPYILTNKFEGNLEAIYDRITMVIHLSEDYLDERLIEQVDAWDGPVTVVIVISPAEKMLAKVQEFHRRLHFMAPSTRSKISVHLLFNSNSACTRNSLRNIDTSASASRSNYPVNVARNIARMFVRSKYLIIGDYEFQFSKDFEEQLSHTMHTELIKNPKSVLVFRIFEVNSTVKRLPRYKHELVTLYHNKQAIEFHALFNKIGHKIPNLTEWMKYTENKGATIQKILKYDRSGWEPQFVSLNTIPLHDENFPYSIRDNTVLRWEMCRQNYTFLLLNNVFMVHRGIKTGQDFSKSRRKLKNAREKFKTAMKQFNQRMDREHPETKIICPNFVA